MNIWFSSNSYLFFVEIHVFSYSEDSLSYFTNKSVLHSRKKLSDSVRVTYDSTLVKGPVKGRR